MGGVHSQRRSAVIVGAGVAGLSAAHALKRAGYMVDVYEQAAALEPRGAALSLWPNAQEALGRIGMLEPILSIGAPINALSIIMASGEPLSKPMSLPQAGLIVARTDLQRALSEHLTETLHLGLEVIDLLGDPAAPSVMVDGQTVRADLVVDAGGLHSRIADRLIGNPAYFRGAAGVVAIADSADAAPPSCGVEYLGTGERAGLMPLSGNRSYWWFMCNQTDPAAEIALDEIGRRTRNWPAALKFAIAHTRNESAHHVAVFARRKPSRLGRGNVICVGDAAHAMDPNQGQGACQALEDAAVLGALAKNIEPQEILPAFERVRRARVRMIVDRSAFWSHAAHGSTIVQKLVRGLVRLTPSGMLERSMEEVHHMPASLSRWERKCADRRI